MPLGSNFELTFFFRLSKRERTCFSLTMKKTILSQGCHCLGGVPSPTGLSSTTPHPRGNPSSRPPTRPTPRLRCPLRTRPPRCHRPTRPTPSTPPPKLSRRPRGTTTTRPTTGRRDSPLLSSTSLVALACSWMSAQGCHFYRCKLKTNKTEDKNDNFCSSDLKQCAKL